MWLQHTVVVYSEESIVASAEGGYSHDFQYAFVYSRHSDHGTDVLHIHVLETLTSIFVKVMVNAAVHIPNTK